jgi:hypothetical protein
MSKGQSCFAVASLLHADVRWLMFHINVGIKFKINNSKHIGATVAQEVDEVQVG